MPAFEVRRAAAEAEIRTAFIEAMLEAKLKHAEAARGMRVSANTITNYLRAKTPVSVARVLAYPKLRQIFLRTLCVEKHDPLPGYVARKKAGR